MINKTVIIAEAGVNHNGDLNLAKKLIDEAAAAQADFVKFQTFKTEDLVSINAKKAQYQISNTKNNDTQFNMLKALELSKDDHLTLINYCISKKIGFLSSAFTIEGQRYLQELNLPVIKVPSGEITNYPLLKIIAKSNKPVYLSTGMSNIEEIRFAIEVISSEGQDRNRITLLHCNSEYPTPFEDVNLRAMLELKKTFNLNIGYSDHTLGIEVPIAAVSMGARVIEKHFTLSREMLGPDHLASLSPNELKLMVMSIRNIERTLSGKGKKIPSKSEAKNIKVARKSIFISKRIEKGDFLREEHLITLRPGDGISPMQWENIIGKRTNKTLESGDKLRWEFIDE